MLQEKIDNQNVVNDIEPQNLQSVQSQFKSKYMSFINFSYSQCVSNQQMYSKFIGSNIQYHQKGIYHKFGFIIHKITQNYQVCEVKILLGKFRIQLLLLNVLGLNPFQKNRESKRGSFGRIYFDRYKNKNIALKCLFFTENSRSRIITQAMKEYCILKICSLLEVSVKADDYYGFHLVLYDDSIMFAMERGEQITKIQNDTPLKQLLAKMHSYNIIHYDIKPENICFSKEYNKIVFIDFGLTQIVKQQFGFKTLVYFRGSPRFCGPEIIHLFGKYQQKRFVDLYYNDLSCLQNSLKMMPKQQNIQYFQDIFHNDMKSAYEYLDILQLYNLKFLIISNKKQELKNQIQKKDKYLLKDYGRNILRFLKCLIFVNFIEEIYQQYFKSLKETSEYEQIKSLLQMRSQHYLLKQSIQDNQNNQQMIIFKQRMENVYSSSIIQIQFNYQESYLVNCTQFLKITDYFLSPQNKEQYLSILIDCLRFDRRNLTAKEKIYISTEFIKLIGTQQNKQPPSLQSVRQVFMYLLKYCISQPYNEWKKEKVLIIIMQTVILSIDIRELLTQLTKSLNNLFVDWTNRLIMSLQIYNICNLGKLRHLQSKNIYNREIMKYLFDLFRQIYLQCLLQGQKSKNKIQNIVSQALLVFKNRVQIPRYKLITSQMKIYLTKMNCIQNRRLKTIMKQFIQFQSLKQLFTRGQMKGCLQYLSIIRNEIYQNNHSNKFHLHFLTSCLWIIFIRQWYCRITSSLLLIVSKMAVFLFGESNNTNLLQQYSLKMINFDEKHVDSKQTLSQFENYTIEIHKILKKIQNNSEFCKKNRHLIDIFFVKFKCWQSTKCFQNSLLNDVEVVMYNLSVYKLFWRMNPSTRQQFKQILKEMELRVAQICCNQPETAFRRFKYYIYAANFYQVQKEISKSQFFYCKLFELDYIDKFLKMKIYCFKNIILQNNLLKNQNRLAQWLLKFYQFNLELGSFVWYFDAYAIKLILITIIIFQKVGLKTELYNLLVSFAKLLSQYPLLTYSKEVFQNIDQISKISHQIFQYNQLIHYFRYISWNNRYGIIYYVYSLDLQKNMDRKREILKKIAQFLNDMNSFIKTKILIKYYYHFQSLGQIGCRKNKVLFQREQYKYLDRKVSLMRFLKMKNTLFSTKKHIQKNKVKLMFFKIKQKINKLVEITKDK